MSSELDQHQNPINQEKKRKRGDSRLSRQTPRYQCYCDKLYLSYPALYLHLKNKHPECFLNNRKVESTKFKQFISPEGYKVHKMEKDNIETIKPIENYNHETMFKPKPMPNYPFPSYHGFPFPGAQNYMMPHIEPKPYYMEGPLQNQMQMPKQMPQYYQPELPVPKFANQVRLTNENSVKQVKQNIISILNLYISETVNSLQLQSRQVLQLELLFSLLLRCIKQKAEKLESLYGLTGNLLKNQNIKYLQVVLPYFREKYLPNLVQRYQTIDQNNLTTEQKMTKSMLMVNKKFSNISIVSKEVQKFQQWLLNQQMIDKLQVCESL